MLVVMGVGKLLGFLVLLVVLPWLTVFLFEGKGWGHAAYYKGYDGGSPIGFLLFLYLGAMSSTSGFLVAAIQYAALAVNLADAAWGIGLAGFVLLYAVAVMIWNPVPSIKDYPYFAFTATATRYALFLPDLNDLQGFKLYRTNSSLECHVGWHGFRVWSPVCESLRGYWDEYMIIDRRRGVVVKKGNIHRDTPMRQQDGLAWARECGYCVGGRGG